MTELYFAPIGDDWIERFDSTVAEPASLPEWDLPGELDGLKQARLWGTTWGKRKQTAFEHMHPGDLVLFYRHGEFFGSGRVGRTVESKALADFLWKSPGSRLIYTVTGFEQISVSRQEVCNVLGYSENFIPRGFMQVSETALSSLLQSYNSVEQAYQEITNGTDETDPVAYDDEPEFKEENEDEQEPEVREHVKIQWMLIQLGLKHGYNVYVAKNDKNQQYKGQRLGENCVEEVVLKGFSNSTLSIIEYVDVIWLSDDYIAKMFEVESTTSIYSGILRMTDFMTNVPNLAVDMYIVASNDDEQKVRSEIDRPTFRTVLNSTDHSSLQYVSFEEVQDKHTLVQRAGPLQQVF